VKSLEESGDMGAMHGRVAIGILIMQDILAVLFLTFSTGKIPSLWALALLMVLLGGRRYIGSLISRSGHGEMVTLCGLFLALVLGAKGFESVGLKADLGALFVGVLVGSHPKSKEVSKSLMGITDLLLVGFFLRSASMAPSRKTACCGRCYSFSYCPSKAWPFSRSLRASASAPVPHGWLV
jgi:predicted Kef-type K+ transport protein